MSCAETGFERNLLDEVEQGGHGDHVGVGDDEGGGEAGRQVQD